MDEKMKKQKWTVSWCKTYYAHGTVEVTANTAQEAQQIVEDDIGDYTGSMQYDPDKDEVHIHESK